MNKGVHRARRFYRSGNTHPQSPSLCCFWVMDVYRNWHFIFLFNLCKHLVKTSVSRNKHIKHHGRDNVILMIMCHNWIQYILLQITKFQGMKTWNRDSNYPAVKGCKLQGYTTQHQRSSALSHRTFCNSWQTQIIHLAMFSTLNSINFSTNHQLDDKTLNSWEWMERA